MKKLFLIIFISITTFTYAKEIIISSQDIKLIYTLNDSLASKELLKQLPLTLESKGFGGNEKIFYPPKKLNTSNTPTSNAKKGTLAYYAPWGDVALFYEDFGTASGLYELGFIKNGIDDIEKLSGIITIKENTN